MGAQFLRRRVRVRRTIAAATGVGMQIDERAVGEVTILDLKGKDH